MSGVAATVWLKAIGSPITGSRSGQNAGPFFIASAVGVTIGVKLETKKASVSQGSENTGFFSAPGRARTYNLRFRRTNAVPEEY
jgi:hypothetical protein